jgi:hypothetical protein
MYSQSIPLVDKEWDGPAHNLDARFDPRIGRPVKQSVRSPRPSGLKDDHVASDWPASTPHPYRVSCCCSYRYRRHYCLAVPR